MKNRIITKLSPILMLLLVLGSCKKSDIVNVQPIDLIPSEKAFTNLNDVLAGLNGVYSAWQPRRSVYLSALLTDEVRLGTGTGYRNVGNIAFNYQNGADAQDYRDAETGGIWTNLYQAIDRANRVLFYMENVPATGADATLKSQYRGELLALRAMAHLELLRWFSATVQYTPEGTGIVIQSEFARAPGAYFPSRSKQSEVVAFISKDLEEARTLIPTSFTDIGRVTRNAVIGGQTRLALHTRNWQAVVDRASEVIASQPITSRSAYPAIWTTRNLPSNQTTEVIWKLNVQQSNLGSAIGSLFQDIGAGAVQASPALKLINSYDKTNDIRFPTFFRVNPAPTGLIAKYGAVESGNGENFLYDIKMMRTSELLLARAEAYAELNQLNRANDDLATLRTNRIANYTHVAITDKNALIDQILLERYRELAFEGQRYHDLRRRSLPVQRDIQDVSGNTSIQTLLPTDPRYLIPIPQQEVFANPNVGQNPGY